MNSPNKALKRDSCRVAFLVCGWFGGKSGLRKVGLCGIHPLTQRYKTRSRPSINYSQGQLNMRTMLTIY
ncbi:TPA: DUF3265 domain-containing protein [Vibrio vulnificus]|nr:DUF3265 domain-containing protein [Vibrio vulnificus]HDY7708904.1 DUF3265 domain-containing protein [Vibrio vulnificus]